METSRLFTIADVAAFSGLKPHTLRIWEKRYDFFKPERNQNNLRQYNITQLEIILKLAVLNQAGLKISALFKLNEKEIEHCLLNLRQEEDKRARELSQLIITVFSIDTDEFDTVLDNCINWWGYDDTINHILIPLMERLQLYTCRKCEPEFDFAVTAIRKKIFTGIDTASTDLTVERKALLFLPEGEHYDFLLLYYFYLLKSKGLKVLYMGTNVSLEKVRQVAEIKAPDFLITYISPNQERRIDELNHFADTHLRKGMLLAAGFENLSGREEQRINVKFLHYKNVRKFLFQ